MPVLFINLAGKAIRLPWTTQAINVWITALVLQMLSLIAMNSPIGLSDYTDTGTYVKLEFHRENRTHRTHRAEKPNAEVTVGLGPMPSDFPGGITA